jgi:hypothetical protein
VLMSNGPQRVHWTDHASVKARVLGATLADTERAVVEHHDQHQRNPGAAQWRIATGQWVVLYNHPDGDDPTAARIVTLWRRR